jgi:protein AFG1
MQRSAALGARRLVSSRVYLTRVNNIRCLPIKAMAFSFLSTNYDVVSLLQERVTQGRLRADDSQRAVAKKLQRLQKALEGYDNLQLVESQEGVEEKERLENEKKAIQDLRSMRKPGLSSVIKPIGNIVSPIPASLSTSKAGSVQRIPRGLYIHGPVGTGKSMLMDMFYQSTLTSKKQRHHFHAFMNMVHRRIHDLKQDSLQTHGRNFSIDTSIRVNPVYRVARQLSKEVSLLCLDEFQVTDIADALILRMLFEVMWSRGTVVVTTSNRPPSDLYQGGINYSYFEPFLGMLEKHCIVHAMKSDLDYRAVLAEDSPSTFFKLNGDEKKMQTVRQMIDSVTSNLRCNSDTVHNFELRLGHNRTLSIPEADNGGIAARLSFDMLCRSDLGAADYRLLAQAFDFLVLEDIPIMSLEHHDSARRFITLIDEMYENQTGLICSTTAACPESLFVFGFFESADQSGGETAPEGWLDQATSGGHAVGALASVKELGYAFKRAASRIKQLTSHEYGG